MAAILFVIGTRPEIIKTAPVIDLLRREKRHRVRVCFTGQHRSMVEQMLEDFTIPCHYNLRIMRPDQSLGSITSRALTKLQDVYRDFRPDIVIVQGDTTTAMAAALAAFYDRIPVAHIEAGLRTRDKYRPYPEEMNRVLISRLADLHFAPTEAARDNLLGEGVPGAGIFVTGNTVIDALYLIRKRHRQYINPRLRKLPSSRKVIPVTMHRREKFGAPIRNVCRALKSIALRNRDVLIIYPVHLNPNVSKPVRRILSGVKNIRLMKPLHYRDLVILMESCRLILTDSGGIQEEAPSFGKPVLVLRETTERPEGVKLGIARIVGSDRERIVEETTLLLNDPAEYKKMVLSGSGNPYGDGQAASRIVEALTGYLHS